MIGKVFLAKEKQSGTIVAIKVIWFRNYIENGIQDQIKNEIEVEKEMDVRGRFSLIWYITGSCESMECFMTKKSVGLGGSWERSWNCDGVCAFGYSFPYDVRGAVQEWI